MSAALQHVHPTHVGRRSFTSVNTEAKEPLVPRRRRLRQGGDGPGFFTDHPSVETSRPSTHQVIRPSGVQDPVVFAKACDTFLEKLVKALRPMEGCNDVFEVNVTRLEEHVWELTINLKPGDGIYTLSVDAGNFSLLLSSPISGCYSYVLCAKTGEWAGEDDGHSLIGLLVRDLIRQCNGYPAF